MKCPRCQKIFMEKIKERIMPDGRKFIYYVCNNCNNSYVVKEYT